MAKKQALQTKHVGKNHVRRTRLVAGRRLATLAPDARPHDPARAHTPTRRTPNVLLHYRAAVPP
jgi:hypothetical protein